jgi:hypothetical protein
MESADISDMAVIIKILVVLIVLGGFSALGQTCDSLKYAVVTFDKTAYYTTDDIKDTAVKKAVNQFLYDYTLVDTTEKGSYGISTIIYNRNGILTVYREGNYDYWNDSTWIGFYSGTSTFNSRTGEGVKYDDLFKTRDTSKLRALVWQYKNEYYDSSDINTGPMENYRIMNDDFRISSAGIYFEIGLNCGRGPCLPSEVPVIIPFDDLRKFFRKSSVTDSFSYFRRPLHK